MLQICYCSSHFRYQDILRIALLQNHQTNVIKFSTERSGRDQGVAAKLADCGVSYSKDTRA